MRITILALITIVFNSLSGQSDDRLKNFQGIKEPQYNIHGFEAEGYDIQILYADYGLDDKGIKAIQNKYSIKGALLSVDRDLNIKVLIKDELKDNIPVFRTYYLLPVTEQRTTIIEFAVAKTRDLGLEQFFVRSYQAGLPSSVYTSLEVDSIDFAGRMIQLGPACRWMSPHNIQCPDYGQMNWAIFDNQSKAESYRDTHFAMTKNRSVVNIKEENWIKVKFEGKEVSALKVKLKAKVPKIIMGGSNVLIIYYVTGEVRGKYVTCILSHYTDDVGADKLPPLLSEVLELID